MPAHQRGVFAEGTPHHHFLEFRLRPAAKPRELAAALKQVLTEGTDAHGAVWRVAAFGPGLAERLPGLPLPAGFSAFHELRSREGHAAPATQRDLWLWLHSAGHDELFEAAVAAARGLEAVAELEEDRPAFVYRDSRDLSGFIDGTANPKGDEARETALIPAGQSGEGGTVVLTQRWVHDLHRLNLWSVPEQERLIGRTKDASVELPEDEMPATAHIRRMEVEVDGKELAIYRRSVPYGTAGEHGLYFLAFSAEQARFELMLRRMFGLAEDGLRDSLLGFTRPVSGSFWFAPSEEVLRRL